jgi:PadR family transcriptional regulator, regulatory protein PadR
MGKDQRAASELLPGTLDMLILKTLSRGPLHGYGVAQHIQQVSMDVLQVGEGSLYPALQRLLLNDWVQAEWGQSDNNRRARFYSLTRAGRKQLVAEKSQYERTIEAIARVMQTA